MIYPRKAAGGTPQLSDTLGPYRLPYVAEDKSNQGKLGGICENIDNEELIKEPEFGFNFRAYSHGVSTTDRIRIVESNGIAAPEISISHLLE